MAEESAKRAGRQLAQQSQALDERENVAVALRRALDVVAEEQSQYVVMVTHRLTWTWSAVLKIMVEINTTNLAYFRHGWENVRFAILSSIYRVLACACLDSVRWYTRVQTGPKQDCVVVL